MNRWSMLQHWHIILLIQIGHQSYTKYMLIDRWWMPYWERVLYRWSILYWEHVWTGDQSLHGVMYGEIINPILGIHINRWSILYWKYIWIGDQSYIGTCTEGDQSYILGTSIDRWSIPHWEHTYGRVINSTQGDTWKGDQSYTGNTYKSTRGHVWKGDWSYIENVYNKWSILP